MRRTVPLILIPLAVALVGCQQAQSPRLDTGSVTVIFHGDISLPALTSLDAGEPVAGAAVADNGPVAEADADNEAAGSTVSSATQRGLVTVIINRQSRTDTTAGDAANTADLPITPAVDIVP